MQYYTIPEAIVFLTKEYGADNMPTSEETLRRAIRTRQLTVQEDGDPGRKGYTISEEDLRAFAQKRLDRARTRTQKKASFDAIPQNYRASTESVAAPIRFPTLFSRYKSGEISSEDYYQILYDEKSKWERAMYERQFRLAQINAQVVALQGEIQNCQSEIEAYTDGISKFR